MNQNIIQLNLNSPKNGKNRGIKKNKKLVRQTANGEKMNDETGSSSTIQIVKLNEN